MERFAAVALVTASRQKNCNGCVQTKRRCDRRAPTCSRCAEKQMPCVYARPRISRPSNNASSPSPGSVQPFFDLGFPFDLGPLENENEATSPRLDTPTLAFMDLIGTDQSLLSSEQWLLADDHPVTECPGTPVDEEVSAMWRKMSPTCDIQPWHLYDPKTTLYYAVNRIKSFTADMAMSNTTPFLHRRLYTNHVPPSILSCFTTTVLYANRTSSNTAMVMRALHSSVRELVEIEGTRVTATPPEKLARVQALFMYEIIRLFDGDIALRAQGEKDVPLLMTWLDELCQIRDNMGDQIQSGITRSQPPKDWMSWVFAESVRRTVIMAYAVLSMYELIKDTAHFDADHGPWAHAHRWTIGRSVWEANSEFAFYRAWKDTPRFVISSFAFDKFLECGRRDDVDDFAEIMLTVYLGVEGTRGFLSEDRSEGS